MQTVKIPMESLYELLLVQLENGGRANLTVTGVSMKPMLMEQRDSVILIPVTQDPKPGDIVLYRRENGRYVLHRVIRKTADSYVFCGDNQCVPETVNRDQMLAVVDGFIRKGTEHTLHGIGYRLYVWAAVNLFFTRRTYIRIRRKIGRLRRNIGNGRKRT